MTKIKTDISDKTIVDRYLKANDKFKPGQFELYYGPMKSRKSKFLLDRIDGFNYMKNVNYLVFKPDTDNRDDCLKSRAYENITHDSIYVPRSNPEEIFSIIKDYKEHDSIDVVTIDELQFFDKGIDEVVEELILNHINVIGAGLNLDFRGEVFGEMGKLMAIADHLYPLKGTCDYEGCNNPSTGTQRLIGGKAAPYDAPIISIEKKNKNGCVDPKTVETYQTRCLEHHVIPGKPKIYEKNEIKKYFVLN